MKYTSTLMTQLAALGAALLFSSAAAGITQEITAVFVPDPSNPAINKFKNTTPVSTICANHMPARCAAMGIFSLRAPEFAADAIAPILANHTDPRQGVMYRVPSEWRNLTVTHVATGETQSVELRIAGVGTNWAMPRPPGVSAWAAPGVSWQSRWTTAPAPCTSSGFLVADTSAAAFLWLVPVGAGACSRFPSVDIRWFRLRQLEYAYEIRTPNPLQMSSGTYTGSTTFSMGPHADFDFGDVMIPAQSTITFNFTLEVNHLLKVEIPPGGRRIELVPQGGWQAWLNQGRKPVRLFRDQTFNISSSSRFKMRLECQYSDGNTCALRDRTSAQLVPVNTSVSLPFGLTDEAGQPISRRPLRLDGNDTELFQPGLYVDRKPGTLHFEITKENVEQILNQGVAKTYSGDVTVIWDSEV